MRLSRNEIEAALGDEMFETIEQQRAETERQEKAEADRAHNWISFTRGAALTNEQLALLREASARVGRPLTDEERASVLYGKIPQKYASGIKIIS